MRTRIPRYTEALDMHTRLLAPLSLGDKVFLQNQRGSHPKKWDKSGTVAELGNYDQYRVKVDGSGCLSLRNMRFLPIGDPLSNLRQPYGLATGAVPLTNSNSPNDNFTPIIIYYSYNKSRNTGYQHRPNDRLRSRYNTQM